MTPFNTHASQTFQTLQSTIISGLETLEPTTRFTLTPWTKPAGESLQGGGIMGLLTGGEVFEKAGVNFSLVHGTFSPQFAKEIPHTDGTGQFWASGVSLVIHPRNPHCPIVHLNVRRIHTGIGWFGGGMDLTPALPYAEDTAHFHHHCQLACAPFGPDAYPKFKTWADDYFILPHRAEPRGVGGIFFDYLTDTEHDPTAAFALTQAVGSHFLQAYLPIIQRRQHTPITAADKTAQEHKRGRYVEFNLLHDRGTRFGLQTGGNTQAILMSLPPTASWA